MTSNSAARELIAAQIEEAAKWTPTVTCPDCGYVYPPGTTIGRLDGTVLDPIVESGGPSGHPDHCPRSEAPPRVPAIGIAQFMPASWSSPPKRRSSRRRK